VDAFAVAFQPRQAGRVEVDRGDARRVGRHRIPHRHCDHAGGEVFGQRGAAAADTSVPATAAAMAGGA
jgi:hypothetical protein